MFAIGTAIFWGLSVAFVKRSYNSLSPAMAIMVGALVSAVTWLKEKISRYQLLGALVTIVGVVLVSTQ